MTPGIYRTCYLAKFLRLIKDQGIDVKPYLDSLDLTEREIFRKQGETDPDTYKKLLLHIVDGVDKPHLGLVIGKGVELFDLGITGLILLFSGNLDKAIKRWTRFQYLVDPPMSLRLIGNEDQAVMRASVWLKEFGATEERLVFAVEEAFTEWNLFGKFLGRRSAGWFDEVWVTYPEGSSRGLYEETFNCPVYFNKPYNQFTFPARFLERKLDQGTEEIAQMLEHKCSLMLQEKKNYNELIYRIREILMRNLGDSTKIQDIAFALNMSERTLRRRLTELDTTFKEIVIDFRIDLATEYLESTDLPVGTIAQFVGYSDTGSFHRVFRNRMSVTPDQYRQHDRLP
ncbi:MAG: AraC family transcriptional regulator [Gammaproteobacteria bacterium]|nr:AraC family transcriptional regulator [Gammaproteobacteria bacterium]